MKNPKHSALFKAMPAYGGNTLINNITYTYSYITLSKPTGKYVARIILKLLNFLLRKKFLQNIGDPCIPGVDMPVLDAQQGFSQIDKQYDKCGVLVVNIIGNAPIKDATVISAEPFMVLTLQPNWKSFDDYKSALSSKYRIRTNKVFELSKQVEKRVFTDNEIQEWIPACAHLLFETIKNKTIVIGNDLATILKTYHQVLKNDFVVMGYFFENKLIGFITYMISDEEVFAMHLGYHNLIGTPIHLYQRMMYDVIEQSILLHKKTLNLGRTAAEIKSTFGAEPLENSFVFFSKNIVFKWALQLYVKYFHKTTAFVLRHPFKTGNNKA